MTPQLTPETGLIAEGMVPRFVHEALIREPSSNVTIDQAYAAWCVWAERLGGFAVLNRRWFTAQMRVQGLTGYTLRDSGVAVYVGWRVRPTAELLQAASRG